MSASKHSIFVTVWLPPHHIVHDGAGRGPTWARSSSATAFALRRCSFFSCFLLVRTFLLPYSICRLTI